MLKVLVIAYYFPPQTSVGVFRTTRFLRHFADNDMEAEILTVRNPDSEFHPSKGDECITFPVHYARELPTKWLWKTMTIVAKSFCRLLGKPFNEAEYARKWWCVDMEYGWIIPAVIKGCKVIKRYRPDVIYVSCPPFSASVVGYILKKITGIPLVLDFRDGWIYSSYREPSDKRDVALAKRILTGADHLIVTSPSDKEHYSKHLPISLIYNGYDRGMLAEYHNDGDVFTLLHLGSWGTFNSSPQTLLECLKELTFPWKLISAGNTNAYLKEYVNALGLGEHIDYVDALPKDQLPQLINKASMLLIVKGETKQGKDSHIAAKIYDSLATGKPTLALAPEGDSAEMLMRYSKNTLICQPDTLQQTLEYAYEKWQFGALNSEENVEFLENFSGEALTKKLRAVMDNINP